jgi:HEAT repeat protein
MTLLPPRSRPRSWWRTVLGIRGDETKLVATVAAVFAVTQASHAFGANAADALFFLRFGVEELPLMILLSGPAVMVMMLAHVAGLGYRGTRRWLPFVTSASAVWALLEWGSVLTGLRVVYPIIWVSTQVLVMVTFTVMWNTAGSSCTTRQAKRLFPVFATAGVAGGVIGNLLTGPLASMMGTGNLLLLQGFLLLASAGLLLRASGLFRDDHRDRRTSVSSEFGSAIGAIRSSSLLRLAAAVAVALSILFFLVVFPFSEAVASSFDSEARVAGFLGLFSSIATAATFLVSLLVTKRLFAGLGIIVSLMIVPLVYASGFALWLGGFGLATAAAVRGLQWVALNAVGGTAFNALFNVLTGRRRGQVLAFMTAVPAQVGTVAAGLILIAGERLSEPVRFVIGLTVSLGALGLVTAMRPAYVDAIVTAVRQGLVGVFDVPQQGLLTPEDGEIRRVLESNLGNPKPEARAVALSILSRFGDRSGGAAIAPLLEDENPLVRSAAFDSICIVDPGRISEHVATALADSAPEVRLQALHFLASQPHEVSSRLAATSLSDPDLRVRAAAATLVGGADGKRVATALLASGGPQEITAVLGEMRSSNTAMDLDPTPFLHHHEPEVRVAAVGASVAASVDPAVLVPGLDDPSLEVRDATAEALAGNEAGRELLIAVLDTGSVSATDVALQALTPVDRFVPNFLAWAGREAGRASRLASLGLALEGEPSSFTRRFLAGVLQRRSSKLSNWVLLAMTTGATEQVMPVVQRGVDSSDAETRAQAIEALETIGERSLMTVLLPLLEAGSEAPVMGEREALRELSTDFDPWLRALAIRCLAEEIESDLRHLSQIASEDESDLVQQAMPSLPPVAIEHLDTMSLMDRVLALQRVPMFSELDPEDLDLIARVAMEIRHASDESIYIEGEVGIEMMVIIEGSAIVSRVRDGIREEVANYGAGEHVGELALLRGGPRSADVRSGEDGLHGLVINKVDLMSILERRPSVAMGMLGTLASRLVEQTSSRSPRPTDGSNWFR